jgi:hypothetical protein
MTMYSIYMSAKYERHEPRYTSQEVAQQTGKSLQAVQRLAINYDLGKKKEGRRLYSDADIDFIRAAKMGRPTKRRHPKPAPATQPDPEPTP